VMAAETQTVETVIVRCRNQRCRCPLGVMENGVFYSGLPYPKGPVTVGCPRCNTNNFVRIPPTGARAAEQSGG
jgi:hypothetical protein